jgi:hypothetical protein
LWDKVLGLGTTDPIAGMIANWSGLVITAYVAGRSIEKRGSLRDDHDERGTRKRVAKLEVQMTHLSEKLDDTHKKVEEMHAIVLQAKGARRVIVELVGGAGLASGLVMPCSGVWPRSTLIGFRNGLPRTALQSWSFHMTLCARFTFTITSSACGDFNECAFAKTQSAPFAQ